MARRVQVAQFQKKIWDHYRKEGRHTLPWRKTHNPYRILVSEMMLQQTQVDRVVPKYKAFLAAFPTVDRLKDASNSDVLALWSGLGYNRRALYLKRSAEAVVEKYSGVFPKDIATLESLPGIGPYTARAVATFSYNQPYTCIETNIRAVFIYEFFPNTTKVADGELLPLIEKTLDKSNPREWYYALMDYGVYLKKLLPRINSASKHYGKQSKFEGSKRQNRGHIIRILTQHHQLSFEDIMAITKEALPLNPHSIQTVINDLLSEKLIYQKNELFHL